MTQVVRRFFFGLKLFTRPVKVPLLYDVRCSNEASIEVFRCVRRRDQGRSQDFGKGGAAPLKTAPSKRKISNFTEKYPVLGRKYIEILSTHPPAKPQGTPP